MSVYLDKHTTYKSWVRKDEFQEVEPISQFGRALQELNVRKLHATPPRPKKDRAPVQHIPGPHGQRDAT